MKLNNQQQTQLNSQHDQQQQKNGRNGRKMCNISKKIDHHLNHNWCEPVDIYSYKNRFVWSLRLALNINYGVI